MSVNKPDDVERERLCRRRQDYLEAEGYEVMRFSNEDVLEDAEAVVIAIATHLSVPPHPNPLPPPVAGGVEEQSCC